MNHPEQIGILRNNWRMRLVYVYAIPGDAQHVRTVGWPIDASGLIVKGQPVETVEPIDAWQRTIALYPKVAVYD